MIKKEIQGPDPDLDQDLGRDQDQILTLTVIKEEVDPILTEIHKIEEEGDHTLLKGDIKERQVETTLLRI
jgi:hypothetical protein